EPLDELALGPRHAVEPPELFEVGPAEVGDRPDVRTGNLGESFYLAEVVHPELDHRPFAAVAQFEESQGKPYEVIKIARVLMRIEFERNDSRRHFLRRRLTVRARNCREL